MGMSDENQIGLARCEPSLQLRITVRGVDARSVVSAWRRVNPKHPSAIWQGHTHFQGRVREPVPPATGAHITPGPGETTLRPRDLGGEVRMLRPLPLPAW